jgi:hypothetical protein
MSENLRRLYYLFIFLSLVVLVFYLGFLYGTREKVNSALDNLTVNNPNGQVLNSISQIQQRAIQGSVNSEQIETFGDMYFIINRKNQTEIVINLQRVPTSIKQAKGQATVAIPQQLRVDIARRVRDSDNKETYQYENVSLVENVVATLTLNDAQNGLRSGSFSGIIDSPIIDGNGVKSNIERVVLRPVDPNIVNVFIDRDADLPLKIGGNVKANVPGQPAPFFWIKLF